MGSKAKLTSLAVKNLGPGHHGDGGGLWLQVSPSGTRSWVLRFTLGGKSREMGLGSVNDVSLAQARSLAAQYRAMAKSGIDPIAARKAERARASAVMTFEQCAEAYIEAHRASWKNAKHAQQWQNTLAMYAFPHIGAMPVAQIEIAHVLRVLQPIWGSRTETAGRIRGRIEAILDWATVRGYRSGANPAAWRGNLQHLLSAPGKIRRVQHHAALPYSQMGEFMAELRQMDGIAARALEFTILTAGRSGEVRGATWAEIDLERRLWVIPGERMKAGKEHRVPLSDAAMALLEGLPRSGEYVFPAPRAKGPLSDVALAAVLRRMGRQGLTVHGFRSALRDWAAETTTCSREAIEHALAHQLKDRVEAAYQRGDLLAKRARLMDDWARFCGQLPTMAQAIPIRRR